MRPTREGMVERKFSLEEILEYWWQEALRYGQQPQASWSDERVIEMEVREVSKHLADGDRVLDVGCGNGYSTVQFALRKQVKARGLDYVPEMIEQANLRLRKWREKLGGSVEFAVGDITALREPTGVYDKVVVIRVVINLGEWPLQVKALRECARVMKQGGVLLLSEATVQGWKRLNALREEWALPPIPMPAFNRYVDEEQVIEAVRPELDLVEAVNFASTYYVGTRVLKPLVIQALGLKVDVADPQMEWNRWFSQLPAWGDYGVQKLFVFRKR